jgi:hypothetical protein
LSSTTSASASSAAATTSPPPRTCSSTCSIAGTNKPPPRSPRISSGCGSLGTAPRRGPENATRKSSSEPFQKICTHIKLGEWGKYLGDATLAAAILDRLAMTSIHIDIDGPSYRDHLAKQRAKDRGIVDDAA